MTDQLDNGPAYRVVVNDEEQYSLWPADRDLPAGWSADGEPASKQECLDRISREWTDLRPLSLRTRLEAGRP
ncbi:MbtH family protein [Umezawaea sp.]|uniref:MbtH family protein n=1 Tax=Umezawaea sp. TaxID=1955258 RepID=UPI002ECFCB8A